MDALPPGRFQIRFGHWIVCNTLVTPNVIFCFDCRKSWSSLDEALSTNEDCPAKKRVANDDPR